MNSSDTFLYSKSSKFANIQYQVKGYYTFFYFCFKFWLFRIVSYPFEPKSLRLENSGNSDYRVWRENNE